ncbi:MAG: hypothetical protein BWX63_00545 [Bacteroidetes bacterium ADurb.Bin041]|jgi:hypothetical protein|nr:MAG: hypothetical protein BWX63_00545 [Bacteroidetes bacterium ADurb.Bin041]
MKIFKGYYTGGSERHRINPDSYQDAKFNFCSEDKHQY